MNTGNSVACLVEVPFQPDLFSKKDATPYVSVVVQAIRVMHQSNTSLIPVENPPHIMIGAESFKGITVIPASKSLPILI